MADVQIKPLGTESAPAAWTLPGNLELLVKRCFAHYDGSGAAGPFLPTLRVRDDAGRNVLEVPTDASVAAGSSVEASWAPFLRTIPASTPSGGATAPSVATFYRSTSLGDAAQTVGAGATANLVWPNASLPSDGSITGPFIGNELIQFNVACITLEMLSVGWEDGTYLKTAVLGTNARINPADAYGVWNIGFQTSPYQTLSDDWVNQYRPNAHTVGDLIHAYADNGDTVAHNIDEAWLTIFAWTATGYNGLIPGWPQ